MKAFLLVLGVLALVLTNSDAKQCPDPASDDPCMCIIVPEWNVAVLNCGYPALGQPVLAKYLKRVAALSDGTPGDNYWLTFSLTDSGLTELPEETFANLTFDLVQIQRNPELIFNPRSLSGMKDAVGDLVILEQPCIPEKEFFSELNKLSSLSTLDFQKNGVRELPDGAFQEDQFNLSDMNLNHNPICYIGKHAFYGLNHLSAIYLQSHTCTETEVTFHPEAFVFKDPSTYISKGLNFHLSGFGLTAPMLENLVLDKFNREWVYLHFSQNPNLTHLPESSFGPYFAQENSTNYVFFETARDGSSRDSFPDCSECGLAWLVEKGIANVNLLQWEQNPDPENPDRISNVRCTNSAGEKVLLVEQDFSHCTK